jgi:hypothetical protein
MWIYKNKIIETPPLDAVGFVYKITRNNIKEDISSPLHYIGKKNFYLKNKKESNWKKYYGSSSWLQSDIEKYGEENFTREIIYICFSKSEMTFIEVSEQLERNVLQVNDSIMRKKYYNLNILGKFFNNEFFTKDDINRVKKYANTGSKEYERICVTNGVKTKRINQLVQDIDIWLCENPEWYLGTSQPAANKDMTLLTDGEKSAYVNEIDITKFIEENPEWYVGSPSRDKFKVVNNNLNIKRILKEDVEYFLEKNPEWTEGNIRPGLDKMIKVYHKFENLTLYIKESQTEDYLLSGWSLSRGVEVGQYIWINKDFSNKKININDLSYYKQNDWEEGRFNDFNKNKVWVNNGVYNKMVENFDKLEGDWVYGIIRKNKPSNLLNSVKVFNEITKEIKYLKKEDRDDFLLKNKDWKSGHGYSTSSNTVYAIDMRNGKKIITTPDEFKNNDYYTSRKTKKVKVKQNNKIIFEGYLDIFLKDNPEYDKQFFLKILREKNNSGKLFSKKGKNTFMNELNMSIISN